MSVPSCTTVSLNPHLVDPSMSALLIGALAGAVHVFSGPDHLAAVAPLSLRRGAWRSGFLWGVGHTSGVWVVACLAFLFRDLLTLTQLSLLATWSDRLAGGGLILLGLWSLATVTAARWPSRIATTSRALRAASLFGILHGLAGTSHYLGVLPAFAFHMPFQAALYLFGFGLSTVTLMTAWAGGVGHCRTRAELLPIIRSLSGVMAIGTGAFWGFA